MKKITAVFSLLLLTTVFAIGCGGKKTGEVTEKPQETTVAGEAFDNAFMSFTYPKEWKAVDVPETKMVNLQRGVMGDAFILIKAEIDDTQRTAADMTNEFSALVKGPASENVTYGTTEYAKISFNYGGMDQTMLVVKTGNNKVTLTVQGKGLMEDEGVLNLLKSIKYKF